MKAIHVPSRFFSRMTKVLTDSNAEFTEGSVKTMRKTDFYLDEVAKDFPNATKAIKIENVIFFTSSPNYPVKQTSGLTKDSVVRVAADGPGITKKFIELKVSDIIEKTNELTPKGAAEFFKVRSKSLSPILSHIRKAGLGLNEFRPKETSRKGVVYTVQSIEDVMVLPIEGNKDVVSIPLKDILKSVEEIGIKETSKKMNVKLFYFHIILRRCRDINIEVKVPRGRRKGKSRVNKEKEEKVKISAKVSENLRLKKPSSPPAVRRGEKPVIRLSDIPPPKEPEVKSATSIEKGGSGNRVESMLKNMPNISMKASAPSTLYRGTPNAQERIKIEKTGIRPPFDAYDRPTERVISGFSFVNKPTKSKDPAQPEFGDHVGIRGPFRSEQEFFIYFSGTQKSAMWKHCPKFVLIDPVPEFAQYKGFVVAATVSFTEGENPNLKKYTPDAIFLGVGKLRVAGVLKNRKNKSSDDDDKVILA